MPSSLLTQLAERRLILVTGKGGTGKSITACALAKVFAKQGKTVWLVELGRKRDQAFSRLHELLNIPTLTHELTPIELPKAKGKLWAARMDPSESLAEYVALKIPGGSFAGLLLKNRVTGSLLEIVPGLMEIVTLGKLWFALTQDHKSKNRPDIVIIDGPASGHAVTLLQAPSNFARLTRHGPLFQDASQMQNFLQDPAQFAAVLVSLPEAMPLSETQEFLQLLAKDFSVPLVLANRCMPDDKIDKKEKIPDWAAAAINYRRRRHQHEQASLQEFAPQIKTQLKKEAPDCSFKEIPLFFPSPEKSLLDRFSTYLETL